MTTAARVATLERRIGKGTRPGDVVRHELTPEAAATVFDCLVEAGGLELAMEVIGAEALAGWRATPARSPRPAAVA